MLTASLKDLGFTFFRAFYDCDALINTDSGFAYISKAMKQQTTQVQRRKCDAAFKQEVVNMVLNGRSAKDVA